MPKPLTSLLELVPDILAVLQDGRLVLVNPAWTFALGWPDHELLEEPLTSFVHPHDVAMTESEIAKLADDGEPVELSLRLRHRDGSYRTVCWSLRSRGGLVYLGVRDVARLAELHERTERGEAVARGVLQTALDPIVVIDTAATIVEANAATSRLFGYEHRELIGRNISMLMPEPYRSQHDEYIARYLREGDPRIIGVGREVEAQRKDGTIFAMSLAVSEISTDRDHLFTGIIHDLTERNAQRDELAAANAELEMRVAERTEQLEGLLAEVQRSNRDLEHFAYIASHDLQAPLRNVRQGLELLDEHLKETVGQSFDDEAHELRDLVIAAVARMETLIKGLLEYSRVHRNSKADRQRIDLNQLVAEVVDLLRPDVTTTGGTIDATALPTVVAHPVQMRQVFQNLIENAIRYRSPQRTLAITIAARPGEGDGDDVIIEVRDNGTGIEEAHHERIFELFRRAHSGYDGVGLGLAICKRIVEGHGGRMWVESAPNQGAAFCFSLPR